MLAGLLTPPVVLAAEPASAAVGDTTPPTSTGCIVIGSDCNRNWMEELGDLIADRPISQLVIPGSHDAASVSGRVCLADPWLYNLCPSAVNQDASIYAQLERGSRYLDLRFAWNCTEILDWTSYHNNWLYDYEMWDILTKEVPRFVANNPREIVILDIRMTTDPILDWKGACEEAVPGGKTPQQHFEDRLAATCEEFVSLLGGEILRPSQVLRSPFIAGSTGEVDLAATEASTATREAMMMWDPDLHSISPTLTYQTGDGPNPGRMAGVTTVQDIWDMNGPQLIVMWPDCHEHLREENDGQVSQVGSWSTSRRAHADGVVTASDYGKYYVNWCEDADWMWARISDAVTGIAPARGRRTGERRSLGQQTFGFYNVSLATTFVTGDPGCFVGPRPGFPTQEDISYQLEQRYYAESEGRALRANLNIIEGDFIDRSSIPEAAILMNAWAGRRLGVDLRVVTDSFSGSRSVVLECSGPRAYDGQLQQVPEPWARRVLNNGVWTDFLPLLEPIDGSGGAWLTHPQFRVKPPVRVDADLRAEITPKDFEYLSGAPPSVDASRFPGREFSETPTFLLSGKRTETFIGTCIDAGGLAVRDTITVEMPDLIDPVVGIEACIGEAGCSLDNDRSNDYTAAAWARKVTLTPICIDDSRGLTCPEPVVHETDGKHHGPTFTATDIEGKTATATFGQVWIDRTKPTITFDLTAAGQPYTPGDWSNTDVTSTPDCQDADSGIASCSPPQTFSDGTHSHRATAADIAGNTASAIQANIKVDTVAPTITAEAGSYVENTWVNTDVTVGWNCSDDRSQIADCSPAQTAAADGVYGVSGTAIDHAGNRSTTTFNVKIDKVEPDLTVDLGGYTEGLWANAPVTATPSCSDAASGIPNGACPPAQQFDEGVHNPTFTVADEAGNSTSTQVGPIQVDLTPPTIEASAKDADDAPYTEGEWATSPVTVAFTCRDALSGIAFCTGPATLNDGEHTPQGTAVDTAGNIATTSLQVRVDTIPPLTTFAGNQGTYSVLDQVVITCTSSDGGSGVASDGCFDTDAPAHEFGIGSFTLSATSTDVAGNVGHGSVTFDVAVDHADLCVLTERFIDGDAAQMCGSLQRAERFSDKNKDGQHDRHVTRYIELVQAAEQAGTLEVAEADTLTAFAQSLIDGASVDPTTDGRVHGAGFWTRAANGRHDKIDFSFDADVRRTDLRGNLRLNDKAAGITIDADVITSLDAGAGIECGELVLDGDAGFSFTAAGTYAVGRDEAPADFHVCGIDRDKNNDGDWDYLVVECLYGCEYSSLARMLDGDIDGGNVDIHRPIVAGTANFEEAVYGTSGVDAGAVRYRPSYEPRASADRHADGAPVFDLLAAPETAALAVGADVITLDPILLDTLPAGTPLVLTAVVENHAGLADSEPAVLRWHTAFGGSGETDGLTNAFGVATFTVTVPAGDIDYTVWVGDLSSNGVRITATEIDGIALWQGAAGHSSARVARAGDSTELDPAFHRRGREFRAK